jgi:hypothetical protein
MNALTHKPRFDWNYIEKLPGVTCTLYDLIEAISGETEPGEDYLVCATVLSLAQCGKIKRASI